MWLKTTKMKKYKKNAQYGGIAQIESDFANKTCGKSASKISCTNEVISWSLCAGSFFLICFILPIFSRVPSLLLLLLYSDSSFFIIQTT